MSLITTVTSSVSVSPTARPLGDQLIGDAGRQQAAEALALLLPFDDRPVQTAQPIEGAGLTAGHAFGEVAEQALDAIVDRRRRGVQHAPAIALIVRPAATISSSSSSSVLRAAVCAAPG